MKMCTNCSDLSIAMKQFILVSIISLLTVGFTFANRVNVAPPTGYDVTHTFTKAEVEDILGGTMKEPKIDSADLSIIRYYPENGTPFLEALIFSAHAHDPADYDYGLNLAKKSGEYKQDVEGIGNKAFWKENWVSGDLIVVKGALQIQVGVSQAKAPMTKLEAAIKLGRMALERVGK